jgi:hypothetical protein
MPKIIRSFLPAVLIAALCSPLVIAQTEPGSLDDLLGADFPPLVTPPNRASEQLPDLNAPLLMGQPASQRRLDRIPDPQLGPDPLLAPAPQLAPVAPVPQLPTPELGPPQSVLEIPRVTADEPAPGELILPELTMPTPENTAAFPDQQRVLRPQLNVQPQDELELLPFDDADSIQARTPQMRTPKALPYGTNAFGSNVYGSNGRSAYSSRSRLLAVPIQVEFYSVTQRYLPYGGFGYGNRPYGSFRPGYSPGGYRPAGGYVPYGGYGGRDCPYRR